MSDTLTIRLGHRLTVALNRESKQTGLAKGEIVRQALASRLQRSGALAVMSRYFGTMDGPSDLSTNKAHRRKWKRARA